MSDSLSHVVPQRRSGTERFHRSGLAAEFDLLGFWRWSASDLLGNTMRGILAEYLIAQAMGVTGRVRTEWDTYDLVTEDNIGIEVKSAAYLQSWYQEQPSKIVYRIPMTRAWDPRTNRMDSDARRHADVYIFCLLDHKDKGTVDPLDIDQWRFRVLTTRRLNEAVGGQQTIGLGALDRIGAVQADYDDLADTVRTLISGERSK